jgi:hypothetical protein
MQEYTQLMAEFAGYNCLPDDDDAPVSWQLPNMVMWVSEQLKSVHRRYSGENWQQETIPFEVTAC